MAGHSATAGLLERSRPAEAWVLGAILVDPLQPPSRGIMAQVLEQVDEEDFASERHQIWFRAMRKMFTEGKPINLVTVHDIIEDWKKWDVAGPVSYFDALIEGVPSATWGAVQNSIDVMKKISKSRALMQMADEVSERAMESTGDVDELAEQAHRTILEVQSSEQKNGPATIAEVGQEFTEDLERALEGGGLPFGFNSGFPTLDRTIGGLRDEQVLVIAARTSVGKTAFAVNVALHCLMDGKRVLFFSLEMPRKEIMARFVSSLSGVPLEGLITGQGIGDREFREALPAIDSVTGSGLIIEDAKRLTLAGVMARIRTAQFRGGVDLIVLDYLQRLQSGQNARTRYEEMTAVSRELKSIAQDANAPILCTSQLNRGMEKDGGRWPILSDLRDSGSIEEDADVVAFLHRPELYLAEKPEEAAGLEGQAKLIIAKNRNGALRNIDLVFDKERASFYEGG